MNLFIDRASAQAARFVNEVREEDQRHYYLLKMWHGADALVVCRAGLTLPGLYNQVVDANVGHDTAMPGFATEEQIGQTRTKITIYRALPGETPTTALRVILAEQYRTEQRARPKKRVKTAKTSL